MAEKPGNAGIGSLEFSFLDQTDVDLLHLKPLPKLVDIGREPVCIPLEDAEG